MMSGPEQLEDLLDRVDRICNGDTSPENLARLEELAASDKELCWAYICYSHVHAGLRWAPMEMQLPAEDGETATSCDGTPAAVQEAAESPRFPGLPVALRNSFGYLSSGWPVAYVSATVILGIGLLIAAGTHVSRPVQVATQGPTVRRAPQSIDAQAELVGWITGMADCKWANGRIAGGDVGSGVSLRQRFALASGLLEITYNTGAKVILQGPVTYEVESGDRGYLSVGKLTAKLEQRSEVRGQRSDSANQKSEFTSHAFSVRTPTAIVTDLGTEFGVEVDRQGSTTSHVFRGSIDVRSASACNNGDGRPIRVIENESVRVEKPDANGNSIVQRVTADPRAFVRFDQLAEFAKEQTSKPMRRWQAYSHQLRRDPSLVAYYTCESPETSSWCLQNMASTGTVLDGKVEGPLWTRGRLPGKSALRFRGPDSGDRITLPEQNRFNFTGAFSVAVWFKVSSFTSIHQCLVAKGDTSWRLQQCDANNTLRFAADTSTGTVVRADGQTNVADRRWHMAVAVYEPVGNRARHRLYVDGRLESETDAPLSLKHNKESVSLGTSQEGLPRDRTFHGLIDEVAIFSRALSTPEIAEMFSAGTPTQSDKRNRRQ